tara:strand:- start:360 stop:773 length:414 start_codon:yes stop_codon:yes gene_type:complete
MANTPVAAFGQTQKTGNAEATAASVITTSSPTNTLLIATAGTNGGMLTKLTAIPRATVTASALYYFISRDSGTTKYMVDSELMEAHTVAATTAIPETVFSNITEDAPVRLEAGDKVYVSSGVALAGGIVFQAEWTDL